MSEAIGIRDKTLYLSKDREKCAVYCTFFLLLYTARFFTLELARSSSMHSMCSFVCSFAVRFYSFMRMHKVLLYHSHFATLNSNVGVKFLQADGEEKEQPTTTANSVDFIRYACCLFVCIHFMLYRFNLSKQLKCAANRRTLPRTGQANKRVSDAHFNIVDHDLTGNNQEFRCPRAASTLCIKNKRL